MNFQENECNCVLHYFYHYLSTANLTPNRPEIVIRFCDTDTIRFTWGDASGVENFRSYTVSISPNHGTRSGDVLTRQLTYSNLDPGTRYTVTVKANINGADDIEETIATQTSE